MCTSSNPNYDSTPILPQQNLLLGLTDLFDKAIWLQYNLIIKRAGGETKQPSYFEESLKPFKA